MKLFIGSKKKKSTHDRFDLTIWNAVSKSAMTYPPLSKFLVMVSLDVRLILHGSEQIWK